MIARSLRRVLTRDLLTSALEVGGGVCLVAGVFVLLGLGAALIGAGLALIVFGYLASLGGAE